MDPVLNVTQNTNIWNYIFDAINIKHTITGKTGERRRPAEEDSPTMQGGTVSLQNQYNRHARTRMNDLKSFMMIL